MTVKELIKELQQIPDKSVEVKMSIGAAAIEGIPEAEITSVDWIVSSEKGNFVILDDYPNV